MDSSLLSLLNLVEISRKKNYQIAIINLIWILVQDVITGVIWKQQHSFGYPAPVIMLINSICPTLLILGTRYFVNHFLVLTQMMCYLTLFLAGLSIVCNVIVVPQLSSFYSTCIMGFPTEDCVIYDISVMWKIILLQTVLCTIVIAIKIVMLRRAYSLYIYLHEYKSPLLKYLQGENRSIMHLVVKSE